MVAATPREVGQDFANRAIGGNRDEGPMVRDGMSERSLQRHRGRFLRLAAVVSKAHGFYRLKRGKQWHAFDAAYVRWMIYEASNAALRLAFASSAPMSAAVEAKAETIKAPSRFCARRSGQGRSRWCRAARELRIGGVLVDNRPGRQRIKKTTDRDGKARFRRPVRRIVLGLSPMAPLAGACIRWSGKPETRAPRASALIGPVIQDAEPSADQTNYVGDPTQPVAFGPGEECAVRQALPASPSAPHGGLIAGVPPKGDQRGSATTATPSAPLVVCERQQRLPDSQRLRTVEVRRILAESGAVDAREARKASNTACTAIAAACLTVGVLRRVLGLESDVLATEVTHPVGWLAGMLTRVGPRVREPDWKGSARATGEGSAAADRAPRAPAESPAKVAVRQALNRAAGDPRAMVAAAAAMRATGEREANAALVEAARLVEDHADATSRDRAAREVHTAAVEKAAAWGTWAAAIDLLEGNDEHGKYFRAEDESLNTGEAVVAGVRWYGVGEAIVVVSPSYERWGLNKQAPEDLARGLSRVLRDVTRSTWRVVVETAYGVRVASAEDRPDPTASPAVGTPDRSTANSDAMADLRRRGWDEAGRPLTGVGAELARKVVLAGGVKRPS